ncbi:MAG: hypothetical protein B7X10_01455, partial [Burkholderiales bacterium 21-58-4]
TGNTGNATCGTVTPASGSKLGDYLVEFTAATVFSVFDPAGQLVSAAGATGSAFNHGGLSFTITAGGTAMAAGDQFTIVVTDNGVALFSVTDPAGNPRPNVTVGTAYTDQLGFTLSQGGTKFVVDDAFTLAVSAGSGKYQLCVGTALDGSQKPSAILADAADPSAGDVEAAIYLTGEFNGNALTYDPSWTVSTLAGAMRSSSIFVRSVVSADPPN